MRLEILITLLSILIPGSLSNTGGPAKNEIKSDPKRESKASAKLPPCSACTVLAKSFEKGLERTQRGKFEGGDTAWEESRQGSGYANSEVRFVEIQEQLCKDVERGENQCHDNHHQWEEKMETWWQLGEDRPTLRDWLCVDELKVCCPEDSFGAKCEKCESIGQNGKICGGNGKCKGAGTRKGNGRCACDNGYAGEICEICNIGFYESYKDEEKLLCSPCHKSCRDHCSGSGPKACAACKPGYQMDTEHGCQDIDECYLSQPCAGNKFCVNTEGTYKCVKCDKACDGCEGDGPDSCLKCAEGYVFKEDNKENPDGGPPAKVCISEATAGKIFNLTNTRYFTYIGLCVAATIIFQRSTLVAGILGAVIAAYITLSEYYLQNSTGELRPIMPDF